MNSAVAVAILALLPAAGFSQDKPVAGTGPQSAEEAYRQASKLLQSQKREAAIALLTRAIFMKPDWAEAYAERGWAQYQLKHYTEAIMDFDQAIKLEDGRPTWYNRRGLAYSYSGHHDRAIEDYNKAMELNPDDSTYYNNRGWAYRELGQYDNAIKDLSRAIQLAPDYVRAFENRSTTYILMEDWSHAIADCTAAIELAPTPANYLKRADAKLSAGDQAGSEEDRRLATEHATSAPVTAAGPPYKPGAGVTSPGLLHKVDPQYAEEARQARLEGTVVLSIVVTSEGIPRDLKVIRSLGLGLDEKAIEAVKQWKFSPGMKDGKPVDVIAAVEVNFRLLSTPAH